MGLVGGDSKLKYVHLLLLILVTGVILLGLTYLNETTQRMEFQQEVLLLKKQAQRIMAEKAIIRSRANSLQEIVDNLKTDINEMQKMFESQIESDNQDFEIQKKELQKIISAKDDVLRNEKIEHDLLKERFYTLNLEMKEFEKTQSRLLEKFSTQSTQCMKVINMVSKLCDKKEGNTSRELKVSNSTGSILLEWYTKPLLVNNETEKIFMVSNSRAINTPKKPENPEEAEDKRTSRNTLLFSAEDHFKTTASPLANTNLKSGTSTKNTNEGIASTKSENNRTVETNEKITERSMDSGKMNITGSNESIEKDDNIIKILAQMERDRSVKDKTMDKSTGQQEQLNNSSTPVNIPTKEKERLELMITTSVKDLKKQYKRSELKNH